MAIGFGFYVQVENFIGDGLPMFQGLHMVAALSKMKMKDNDSTSAALAEEPAS